MLYKVTPMLSPPGQKPAAQPKDPNAPKQARKKRKSAVYDGDGNEVLITMMCLKCRGMKPLTMFGLRKMADGAIRNQPWCRTCRSGAGTKKGKDAPAEAAATDVTPVLVAQEEAAHDEHHEDVVSGESAVAPEHAAEASAEETAPAVDELAHP